MLRLVFALVFVIPGCRRDEPSRDPGPDNPPPQVAPIPSPADAALDEVALDCASFQLSGSSGCATQPDVSPDAIALVEAAAQIAVWIAEHHPPADRFDRLAAAVERVATLDAAQLPVTVRVVVQNAALKIALYAPAGSPLTRAALAAVTKLALPPATLAHVREGHGGVEDYLHSSEWQFLDRGSSSLHASLAFDTAFFVPVVVGARRAIFSQLVAIDDHGKPQLTSVVGSLEMRAGPERTSSACVMHVDIVRLACTKPGLWPVSPAAPETHFFRHQQLGRVACNGCHDSTTFPPRPPATARATLDGERRALVERLEAALALRR